MEYEKKSLVELKEIAKEKGLKKISAMKKQELIDALKAADESSKKVSTASVEKAVSPAETQKKRVQNVEKIVSEKKISDKTVLDKNTSEKKVTENRVTENRTAVTAQAQHKPERKYAETKENIGVREPAGEYKVKSRTQPMSNSNNNGAYRQERGDRNEPHNIAHTGADDISQLDSGEVKSGILEVMGDGYAFIRCDNFLPGEEDVYVSPAFVRRFDLRTGDYIIGNTKVKTGNEKFSALLYMKSVNGYPVSVLSRRKRFEDLTPIFPNERIHLETPGATPSMRMVDLISPIGKGQRGMIVSQPKTGKTTLLKQVAKAVKSNHPDMHIIILLIDERPEEVTDIKEYIQGDNVEVIYSTFDELPEKHKRVSEMVIERAKRLVEHGKDVMILLDSITRLARAYNLTVQPSGRTLSGGLDPAALHMPKRFFGAARNMREGGSLTILATALVDTGSRMDDVVFEEFKGTGNMELVLDRSLSEKRIFPAIDITKSSTRRDDLLLSQSEMEAGLIMRRAFNSTKAEEAVEQIVNMFVRTKNNHEFVETIKKIKLTPPGRK